MREPLILQPVLFHKKAKKVIKEFPSDVRKSVGKALFELQKGHKLTLPLSRHMPSIGLGVEELRIKDESGAYRIFYFKKHKGSILVFHAFVKKDQKTPDKEIKLAQQRLKELLHEKK